MIENKVGACLNGFDMKSYITQPEKFIHSHIKPKTIVDSPSLFDALAEDTFNYLKKVMVALLKFKMFYKSSKTDNVGNVQSE